MLGEVQRGTRRTNASRKHLDMMDNSFQLQEEREYISLVEIGCRQEKKCNQTEL